MSTDLEQRLRTVLRDSPEPDGLHERLRSGALARMALPQRRTGSTWLGRGLRWSAAAIGAGVIALVVGLLIVATPSDPPAAAGSTGVEYVLRPIPLEESLDSNEAAASLAELLRIKGARLGVGGLTATLDGDRVTLFVPRTHDITWPAQLLLENLNVAVYDNTASLIAAGPDLDALVAAARDAAPTTGGPESYYAALPQPDPRASLPTHIEGPFAMREEAAARAAWLGRGLGGGRGGRVVAVPAGISLVLNYGDAAGGSSNLPVLAILRDPVVSPGDIESVTATGAKIAMLVAPAERATVLSRVAAFEESPDGTLTVVSGASTLPGISFESYDAASGEITFTTPSEETASDFAATASAGGLDALVAVEEARPVGPAPVRTGERVSELPEGLLDANPDANLLPRPDTILRVLETRVAGETWTVYSWVGVGGQDAFGVEKSQTAIVNAGCPISPSDPFVQACVAGAMSGEDRTVVGRAGEGVVTLRAAYSEGPPVEAVIHNGWFLMFLDPRRGTPVRIEALDASGVVLQALDPRVPGRAAIFAPD